MDDHIKMLTTTVQKLYHRGALRNIQKIFLKTHTADIAVLLEAFLHEERLKIIELVYSWEDRATILSYLDKDIQIDLVKRMSKENTFRLAKLMDSDDLADLLGHLEPSVSQEILDSLDIEESEDVSDLMGYPEDSAGGLMSSDYFSMDESRTVEETIRSIQAEQDNNTILFYIYVVREDEQLIGVLSLKQLLLSPKHLSLKEIMFSEVISVTVDTPQEDVAKIVERYDFLSLPVVDNNNKLEGVITVDDVIDVIREEAQEDILSMGQAGLDSRAGIIDQFKARLPWMMIAFLSSVLSFIIIQHYVKALQIFTDNSMVTLISMVPVIITLGTTAGSQSATTTIGSIRAGQFANVSARPYMLKELSLSLLFALLFSSVILVLGFGILNQSQVLPLALAVGGQIILAINVGSSLPFLIDRLNFNPMLLAVPIFTLITDVSALLILFSVY